MRSFSCRGPRANLLALVVIVPAMLSPAGAVLLAAEAPAPLPSPSCSARAAQRGGTMQTYSIVSGGRARSYDLHLPQTDDPATPLPLVIAFHGRGETPHELEAYSGLSDLRAIVAYPAGLPGAGGKPSWSSAPTSASGVDDVRFTEDVVTALETQFCIDRERIFAAGKSDGGGMAALLACRDADRFKAIASLAGAYYPIEGGCSPRRPISILEFHGTNDGVIPIDGIPRRSLPAIADWLAAWARRDSCPASVTNHITPTVERESWSPCANATRVVEERIAGGGHTWPGALAKSGPGTTDDSISATREIARFFAIPL